ncbi:hypothetical protein VNO78_08099 [Psophocarpus tetragonolobus]|uniref:ACB domain-containing protein n=1 Tax=Psophocarpus tetragonolobus TaxID=3891 RepID=A0AAN9T4G7_PSOTE
MELLWDLLFTILLSLLLPLLFLKLLSLTPNFQPHEKVPLIPHDRDHDSKSWETDEVVQIDEFRDKPILGKLTVQQIVDVTCGSPKICNSEKVDENRVYNEIELVDLADDRAVVELIECDSREDEDDWEGIERTELEKRFGAAVVFVGSKNSVNLSNDVKMKLHGYHRIATQGPCHEPQPMALKFSARAKWIAWRQLGIMSPEQAMEKYISLLSERIPDWAAENPNDNAKPASAEFHASVKLTL